MIDLHVHSDITDGTATPSEIIQIAKQKKLSAIALTDHDTIDGLEEASVEAKKQGVLFINGIELSVDNGNGRLLHILGLGLDIKAPEFLELYNNFKKERQSKLDFTISSLEKMGIKLKIEDLIPYKTGEWLDRQSVAKWLVGNNKCISVTKAWTECLDKIPYQKGEILSPEMALKLIKAAKGKSFLAHYNKFIGFQDYTVKQMKDSLLELKKLGLDGMELYYPSFSIKEREEVLSFINLFNFIPSGGTDFHGENRADIKLGTGEGDFNVPDSLLKKII